MFCWKSAQMIGLVLSYKLALIWQVAQLFNCISDFFVVFSYYCTQLSLYFDVCIIYVLARIFNDFAKHLFVDYQGDLDMFTDGESDTGKWKEVEHEAGARRKEKLDVFKLEINYVGPGYARVRQVILSRNWDWLRCAGICAHIFIIDSTYWWAENMLAMNVFPRHRFSDGWLWDLWEPACHALVWGLWTVDVWRL